MTSVAAIATLVTVRKATSLTRWGMAGWGMAGWGMAGWGMAGWGMGGILIVGTLSEAGRDCGLIELLSYQPFN